MIRRTIRLGNAESWIEARPCRSGKTILRYELDYGSGNPIGRQSLEVSLSPRHFHMNLAPSRTFMLEAEAAAMKAQGIRPAGDLPRLARVRQPGADRQSASLSR